LSASGSIVQFENVGLRYGTGAETLSDLAFTLRDRALDAWSTAATQLDVITIDATGGHLHASLPIAPQGDETPSTDDNHS
jgi:hypothetical protein